jgi:uncharacterized protein involved in exopolysaccharide biosynthesis
MRSEQLAGDSVDDEGLSLLDLALPLAQHWKLLLIGPLLAGLVALGSTYLMQPIYTSRTVFLPPQQQQSAAAAAVAQLGALSGLIGGAAGIKSPADQYVALLQSVTVADRLIDEFKLMQVYDSKYRVEARKELASNTRISLGKKDGLIAVEVDDNDPQRAAAIAARHVDELRRLTSELALTEAQQRRAFFEEQLKKTRDALTGAQLALQTSGPRGATGSGYPWRVAQPTRSHRSPSRPRRRAGLRRQVSRVQVPRDLVRPVFAAVRTGPPR